MNRAQRNRWLTAATFLVTVCACESPRLSEAAEPKVTEQQARTLALKHYRNLSQGLYFRDPVSQSPVRFPEMAEEDFQYVESRGEAWLVRAEPPAGWTVIARVDKQGDWVEILRWGFSPR